jgi:hypothetical protein
MTDSMIKFFVCQLIIRTTKWKKNNEMDCMSKAGMKCMASWDWRERWKWRHFIPVILDWNQSGDDTEPHESENDEITGIMQALFVRPSCMHFQVAAHRCRRRFKNSAESRHKITRYYHFAFDDGRKVLPSQKWPAVMVLCQGAPALAGDFVGDSGYRPSIWKACISAKTSVFSVSRNSAASSVNWDRFGWIPRAIPLGIQPNNTGALAGIFFPSDSEDKITAIH